MEKLLQDNYNRIFSYLRLSLTDRCNFKCNYCLPQGYKKSKKEELTKEEIINLVKAMTGLGVEKIRLTGGEPTLRRDFFEIAKAIKNIPNIKVLALTTNGFRLEEKAKDYYEAGIDNINISLDSLDSKIFQEITATKILNSILKGIEECLKLGFKKVKINAVLLKSYNYQELSSFLGFIKDKDIDFRFISLMPTLDNQNFYNKEYVSVQKVIQEIESKGWKEQEKEKLAGPARVFTNSEYKGKVGIINPYCNNFCDACNRLRVDSFGNLMLCLLNEGLFSLKSYLQSSNDKEKLQETLISLVKKKPEKNILNQSIKKSATNRSLSCIGG